MRKSIIIAFLCMFAFGSLAQNNIKATEAKAAYLLAEEAFAASNYPGTLNYLETAATKLGGANSKIIYLKIMALQELSKTDKRYRAKIDSAIADFEKAPDVANFNEEKVLEVVKIKMQIKQEADADEAFKQFNRDGWMLGATLDELKIRKPEFFSDFTSSPNPPFGEVITKNIKQIGQPGIGTLYVSKNKLFGYSELVFFNYPDDAALSKGKAQIAAVLENLKSAIPFAPVETQLQNPPNNGCQATTNTYVWARGSRVVTLTMITTSGPSCQSTSTASLLVMDESEIQK